MADLTICMDSRDNKLFEDPEVGSSEYAAMIGFPVDAPARS